jgi:hypothetical protein
MFESRFFSYSQETPRQDPFSFGVRRILEEPVLWRDVRSLSAWDKFLSFSREHLKNPNIAVGEHVIVLRSSGLVIEVSFGERLLLLPLEVAGPVDLVNSRLCQKETRSGCHRGGQRTCLLLHVFYISTILSSALRKPKLVEKERVGSHPFHSHWVQEFRYWFSIEKERLSKPF